MKVKNVGKRPIWVDGIKIMPGGVVEIDDKFKDEISGLPLMILEAPKPSDFERLKKIKYVEDELAKILLDKFGSIENIKKASIDDLAALPGIGKKRAKRILEYLKKEGEV